METVSSNIDNITIAITSEIQRELDIFDVTSLVFILYDVPLTALQRLTLLGDANNLDLLEDWAKEAQSRPTWKYEFLEALSICQLYGVIRKLGFNVDIVKSHFLPDNVNVSIYINHMKKMLYKLCEQMTSDNFTGFKNALATYNMNISQHRCCELVLLELMCNKFIIFKRNTGEDCHEEYQVGNLTRLIENLPDMKKIAAQLSYIEKVINGTMSSCNLSDKTINNNQLEVHIETDKYEGGFEDITKLIRTMVIEKTATPKLKIDTSKASDAYHIFNENRVGICYIINEEHFLPSKRSIEMNCQILENRMGSAQDATQLQKTMESFNFKVIVDNNLKYDDVKRKLKMVVKDSVHEEDSIFILCVLSHGIKGHIYTADSIPLKVSDLRGILDSDDAIKLKDKPKVLIIQACQSLLESTKNLVSDAPTINTYYGLKKTDFLTYWATVPEYLAFRDEKAGSVFIQILCDNLNQLAKKEHLDDIFKKVNDSVINFCMKHKCMQVPLFESTLRKKLYFILPE